MNEERKLEDWARKFRWMANNDRDRFVQCKVKRKGSDLYQRKMMKRRELIYLVMKMVLCYKRETIMKSQNGIVNAMNPKNLK